MKNRSVPMVIILGIITIGIYYLIWLHQTRAELLEKKAVEKIMSPWLVFIPFVGGLILLYSYWQHGEGIAKVTNGKYSQPIAFILLWLLGPIGAGIIQAAYNEVPGGAA